VARIDAHLLNRPGVTRLCYAGNVLHARPAGFNATREPIQIGAEIYGHAGLEADVEIQELMLAALQVAGLSIFVWTCATPAFSRRCWRRCRRFARSRRRCLPRSKPRMCRPCAN
jgi:ATP phosphoribosyltransferase regulatory subunit HisZ